ncbi:MAG: glycosyltransferase family 39 protein [Nanoarchaeota archaeon]|nr:glycosyltransferase family 39 protein [Nanoarchaeota archaeon]
MKISLKLVFVILIGILISFLGYKLRLQKFSSFPPINDTGDEYKYAFNGISLIKNGVPESWSWWDDYGKFPIKNFRGTQFRMVKPYFDEPPLFGLMMGSYAISKGMDSYDKVDAGALRWPMLKIGALNIFLLFVLIYFASGLKEAVVASLLYATIPTIVLSSRMPFAENVLISVLLFCLICLRFFLRNNSKILLILFSIASSSAILMKQVGVYIPATLFLLLLSQKKYKPAITVAIFALIFFGIWFAYGYHYNWQLFIHLQQVFSGRELYLPTMIINLFDTFRIAEKTMSSDGLLIFGWVSLAAFPFIFNYKEDKNKLSRLIVEISSGIYLILIAIMSGHLKGWYRYPVFPFACWASAAIFLRILENPRFLSSFFFISLAFFSSYIGGTGEHFFNSFQTKTFQVVFPLIIAPILFFEIFENENFGKKFKNLSKIMLCLIFILIIVMNIRTIYLYQDQFWY